MQVAHDPGPRQDLGITAAASLLDSVIGVHRGFRWSDDAREHRRCVSAHAMLAAGASGARARAKFSQPSPSLTSPRFSQ